MDMKFAEVNLKVKKLDPNAVLPSYAKPGDAAMDLTAIYREWDNIHKVFIYGTGLALEIPKGYVGLLFPRSSIFKVDQSLTNCVGVIDSGYRGEVKAVFKTISQHESCTAIYGEWNKIVQLMILPYPTVLIQEVSELSTSDRGEGGFGSSGK